MTTKLYRYPLEKVREIHDLRDMLQQSVELYGDRVAYWVKDPIVLGKEISEPQKTRSHASLPYSGITFRQLYKDVQSFATGLMGLGLGLGARVAIAAETRYEWYVSYLATVNGLGIVVPLDKELPALELQSLLQRSEADVLIYSSATAAHVNEIRGNLPAVKYFIQMDPLSDEDEENLYFHDLVREGRLKYESGDDSCEHFPLDPDEMRILLFTSGTTDKAKAVMLSHRNICSNLMDMCSMIYIDEEDIFLSVLPLHHTYECTCGFLCPLYQGCSVAVCDGLRYIAQNLRECKATIILVVPLMLEAFHRQIMKKVSVKPLVAQKVKLGMSLSLFLMRRGIDIRKKFFKEILEAFGGHLRLLISGGAAISEKLLCDMQAFGFNCIQGYGVTECSPILAVNRVRHFRNHAAGLPMPSVDIKIIDADENGIGEIIGRGPNIMLGYYQNPELTAAVIDSDGYYHTGDLGYLDDDGFVVITGRKANLIVTKNGKNIFPEEIEFLLAANPLVSECLVYGEKQKDGDFRIAAEIYPSKDAMQDDPELKDHTPDAPEVYEKLQHWVDEINARLVHYKRIRRLTVRTTEFEKTSSKKIKRQGYPRS